MAQHDDSSSVVIFQPPRRRVRHGLSHSSEYHTWVSMRQRCTNPRSRAYPDYGARGITVCPAWSAFLVFLTDMGPRPRGLSLERRDNDGHYCPENCEWATATVQQRNKRHLARYTYNGKTQLLSEWADELHIPRGVLSNRIYQGWPRADVFTLPLIQRHDRPSDAATRVRARTAVGNALRDGRLHRPAVCVSPDCSSHRVEAHHYNGYDKACWLDVVWLCRQCHRRAEALGLDYILRTCPEAT